MSDDSCFLVQNGRKCTKCSKFPQAGTLFVLPRKTRLEEVIQKSISREKIYISSKA